MSDQRSVKKAIGMDHTAQLAGYLPEYLEKTHAVLYDDIIASCQRHADDESNNTRVSRIVSLVSSNCFVGDLKSSQTSNKHNGRPSISSENSCSAVSRALQPAEPRTVSPLSHMS